MNFIKLFPVVLSILLLCAHYYRAGLLSLVFVLMGSLLTLLVRQKWPVRIVQTLLFIGSIEWIRTLVILVSGRQGAGMPWVRMAFILGSLSLFTIGSIFLFRAKSLRKRYQLDDNFPERQ